MFLEGSIPACIQAHGYADYARRNVNAYRNTRRSLSAPTVLALSSGFLTYASATDPEYDSIRNAIEADPLTALPSFDLETCVSIIVQRQLSKPYLPGNQDSEERRIRERFPRLMNLGCVRFRSDEAPERIAARIERFARERVACQT